MCTCLELWPYLYSAIVIFLPLLLVHNKALVFFYHALQQQQKYHRQHHHPNTTVHLSSFIFPLLHQEMHQAQPYVHRAHTPSKVP